jgi:hypothetical protein
VPGALSAQTPLVASDVTILTCSGAETLRLLSRSVRVLEGLADLLRHLGMALVRGGRGFMGLRRALRGFLGSLACRLDPLSWVVAHGLRAGLPNAPPFPMPSPSER